MSTVSSIQIRERVIRRERRRWAPYARHLQPLINDLRKGGPRWPSCRLKPSTAGVHHSGYADVDHAHAAGLARPRPGRSG